MRNIPTGGINKRDRVASLREQFLKSKKIKWESGFRFSRMVCKDGITQWPTLADKGTGMTWWQSLSESISSRWRIWDAENFDYEEWLETNMQKEMGINLPENRVPSIQYVLFDKSGHALGLNLRLEGLLNYAGHIGYSIRPSARGQVITKSSCGKAW